MPFIMNKQYNLESQNARLFIISVTITYTTVNTFKRGQKLVFTPKSSGGVCFEESEINGPQE